MLTCDRFQWGAQGPEPAKKLWDLVYDRITNFHGINNIIWVWNSIAEDWYPGDDVVDILSADVYTTGNGVCKFHRAAETEVYLLLTRYFAQFY